MVRGKNNNGTTQELLHGMLVNNSEFSVAKLAELLGVPEYMVDEWGDPNNKRKFPLSMLIPLTRATENTGLIEHLATSVGLVVSKARKCDKSGLEQVEDLQMLLLRFSQLLPHLIAVYKDQVKLDSIQILTQIDRLMGMLAGVREEVERLNDHIVLD